MGLKAKLEAIIYAAEEPITLEQIALLVKDVVLGEEVAEAARAASSETADEAALPESADEPTVSRSAVEAPEAVGATPEEPGEQTSETVSNAETGSESAVSNPLPEAAAEEPTASPTANEPEAASEATVTAPEQVAGKLRKSSKEVSKEAAELLRVKSRVRSAIEELIADYQREERGIEIRQVAGGFRMATKPEHHDVVRAFAKSLKPPVRLSIAALETLAVIAYKQPVTIPEISEIRGVEASGVIGTLLDRKLIATAGRKQVIGRPILYKTSKEFLLRFGLNDLNELPSMEEFEKLAMDGQVELFTAEAASSADGSADADTESVPVADVDAQLVPTEEGRDSTDEPSDSGTAPPATPLEQAADSDTASEPAENSRKQAE